MITQILREILISDVPLTEAVDVEEFLASNQIFSKYPNAIIGVRDDNGDMAQLDENFDLFDTHMIRDPREFYISQPTKVDEGKDNTIWVHGSLYNVEDIGLALDANVKWKKLLKSKTSKIYIYAEPLRKNINIKSVNRYDLDIGYFHNYKNPRDTMIRVSRPNGDLVNLPISKITSMVVNESAAVDINESVEVDSGFTTLGEIYETLKPHRELLKRDPEFMALVRYKNGEYYQMVSSVIRSLPGSLSVVYVYDHKNKGSQIPLKISNILAVDIATRFKEVPRSSGITGKYAAKDVFEWTKFLKRERRYKVELLQIAQKDGATLCHITER